MLPVTQSPHLLTVLHAAERTGPPLFALQFLRWLHSREPSWRTSTLFLDADGPLRQEFDELGPVTLAEGRAPYRVGLALPRRALAMRDARSLRRDLLRHGPIDLAHIHCIGSMKVQPALPTIPILLHLHELSVGQDLHLGPRARVHVGEADRYLAVSEGVRTEFLERFNVHPDLVTRQWGFVDPKRLDLPAHSTDSASGAETFVVVSSGVRHWRKAPELFVRVAQAARQAAPDVPWRFRWIGGTDAGDLESLAAGSDVADIVEFLPHQPDPLGLIASSDVFVLTAREDAFPLVCVEAVAAGRPLVTFANGGAAELAEAASCGTVSPYLDIAHMAQQLVALARDPVGRRALGENGRHFAANHLLIDHAGPRIVASLRQTMANAR